MYTATIIPHFGAVSWLLLWFQSGYVSSALQRDPAVFILIADVHLLPAMLWMVLYFT
jgi:hypothetical protein